MRNASSDYGDGPELFYKGYLPYHQPIASAICAFGILANCVNIVVLTRKEMLGPTNLLLTGLSIAQLGLVLDYLLLLSYDRLAANCLPQWHNFAWTFYKLINVNLNLVFHTVALMHTVLLAAFRYIAIKHPTRSRTLVSTRSARLSIVIIYLSVPIICLPVYFATVIIPVQPQHVDEYDLGCNRTGEDIYDLSLVSNEILTQIPIWMFGTVFKIIPCVVISLLSYLLIGTLKKVEQRRRMLKNRPGSSAVEGSTIPSTSNITSSARKQQQVKSKQNTQRSRITKMLLMIVCLFVAVELPQGILCFCVGVIGSGFALEVYMPLGPFFEMLTILYSSINFILYCTMSTQFQDTFKQLVSSVFDVIKRRVLPKIERKNRTNVDARASNLLMPITRKKTEDRCILRNTDIPECRNGDIIQAAVHENKLPPPLPILEKLPSLEKHDLLLVNTDISYHEGDVFL